MLNWVFKKVVTFREKVAVDLGKSDEEKPFLDHLDDLRSMLVNVAITLLVVTIAAFAFYKELLAITEYPLILAGIKDKIDFQNFKVAGGFMTAMNVSLVSGVVLSFPILLYFLLKFILPGLHSNEKKVLFPAMAVGAGLFMVGVLFAYFVVSPRALGFFYEFNMELDNPSSPDAPVRRLIWERLEYVKFVCQFILIFGACFELPVVVLALVKLDILNYKVMATSRSWAAVIIAITSAVITPTQDAMTLALLAVPMYVLYEICIWLAWWMDKRDRKLYPEFYKEQDEVAKELDVNDDWDNDQYRPWGSEDEPDDGEEDDGRSKAKNLPEQGSATTSTTSDATQPSPGAEGAEPSVESPPETGGPAVDLSQPAQDNPTDTTDTDSEPKRNTD